MELSNYLRKPGLPISLEQKQVRRSEQSLKPVRKAAETAALLLIAAVFIFPFLWMLTTSFKTLPELLVFPPPFFPKNWIPDNYLQAWNAGTFPKYIGNSLVVSVSILILQFLVITPAAYAFARKKFRGSRLMFNMVLVGLMVPEQVTFLPVYLMFSKVGLIDTYASLILPFVFSPFGIFFLTQSIRQIPDEIFEAAWLDQANEFTIMTKIVLPMIRPALITFGLFSFISHWNDYFWALSMTTSENIRTLSIGVTTLLNNEGLKNWNVLMAGNMIQVVPILILYLAASSKIKSAFTYSGIK